MTKNLYRVFEVLKFDAARRRKRRLLERGREKKTGQKGVRRKVSTLFEIAQEVEKRTRCFKTNLIYEKETGKMSE